MKLVPGSVLRIAALRRARLLSGRPSRHGAMEEDFARPPCPARLPGGCSGAWLPWREAQSGWIPLRAESEILEPGRTPESLARTRLEPLEG
jgi:hypothetical protein